MRSSDTVFPSEIDNRIYWSDIDLTQTDDMAAYQSKIAQGDYTGALDILNNSTVFWYGAWLINLFKNRLVALHNYMPYVKRSVANIYNMFEPTKPEENIFIEKNGELVNTTIWIESDTLRPHPVDMEMFIPYYEMMRVEEEEIDNMYEDEDNGQD